MPSTVRSLLGYAVINSATFALDLGIVVVLHGELHWPLPLAITLGYLTAFTVSFLLNRRYNFRSHAPIGPQARVYALVVAANYLVLILGVGDGLARLGVDYRVARLAAAAGEAVFMYCAMRWIVFREPAARRGLASGRDASSVDRFRSGSVPAGRRRSG